MAGKPVEIDKGRTEPVEDSVPKVDQAVAVGEDLAFQRKWWRFEQVTWIVFSLILLADVLGAFGRGWLAHSERHTPDGGMRLKYERIERVSTPSVMTILFSPGVIRENAVRLFVSNSIVQTLGAQRISPQPEHSEVGNNGITYVFPANGNGISVQISLEPSSPGVHRFRMGVPDAGDVQGDIVVMP